MTKQELIILNFSQKIASGRLFLDMSDSIFSNQDYNELWGKYREIKQVQGLFNYESAKVDADLVLLSKCISFLKIILGSYLNLGTIYIKDAEVLPVVYDIIVLKLEGGSGGGGSDIDDDITSTTTTYSSAKIVQLLGSFKSEVFASDIYVSGSGDSVVATELLGLNGVELLTVHRGVNKSYKPITTGTPTASTVLFSPLTASLIFQIGFLPSMPEDVWCLYKVSSQATLPPDPSGFPYTFPYNLS